MRNKQLFLTLVAASLSAAAQAQNADKNAPAQTQSAPSQSARSPSANDQERASALVIFIHNADQRDIEMSNLAKTNSDSQQVKDFANKVASDSKASENQVQTYARDHHINLNQGGTGTGGSGTSKSSALDDQIELERRSRAIGSATGEYAFMAEPGHPREAAQRQSDYQAELNKLRNLKGPEFDREYARAMTKEEHYDLDQLAAARSHIRDPAIIVLIDQVVPTMKDDLNQAQKLQVKVSRSKK